MIKSNVDIRVFLQEHYPKAYLCISDRKYYIPKRQAIIDFFKVTHFEQYKYIPEGMDCDDFSLIASAFMVQERYRLMLAKGRTKATWLSYPFGEVHGSFEGKDHAVNICIVRDAEDSMEVLKIEPQNDLILPYRKGERAWFIKM